MRAFRRGSRALRMTAGAAVTLAAVVTALVGWGTPPWYALPLLVAGVTAAERALVHLRVGRSRWTFSLTEAVLGAAWVCAPGGWTVVGLTAGVLAAQWSRKLPPLRLQYNVAQFAAAAAVGSAVDRAWGYGVPGACVGLLAFFLVNHCLVAVAVSLTARRRFLTVLARTGPVSALHVAGNASIGLLAGWLVGTAPLGLAGLAVPLGLLWCAYEQEGRRSGEARLYAELAAGQERATTRSLEASAQAVLTAAARSFGGADVEMLLVTPEGPVRLTGNEHACASSARVGTTAFDAPWVLAALAGGRVSERVEPDGRPACAFLVGSAEAPQALVVARRPRGAGAFGRRELQLAEVLARQAESWLSVAELTVRRDAALQQARLAGQSARSLGDLGAHTAPALFVLRETAGRLARLADSPAGPDPVSDIVGELQSVELAVASLLGAVALAAEEAPPVDPAAPVIPAPRGGTDPVPDEPVRLGALPPAVWA